MSILCAYLSDGSRLPISSFDRASHTDKVYCSQRHEVVAKKGDIMIHHYAHAHFQADCVHKAKGKWHLAMQDRILPEFVEIQIKRDGKLHIADALCGRRTIEFQHSPICKEEVQERERFYGANMIWVFDASTDNGFCLQQVSRQGAMMKMKVVKGPKWAFTTSTQTFLDAGNADMYELLSKRGNLIDVRIWSLQEVDVLVGIEYLKPGRDMREGAYSHPRS
jgi:competence CoiA-like predicted nuclease